MTPDQKRAYQRGYDAGRRRVKREKTAEQRAAEELAFRDRAFLAALPACITQSITAGDENLTAHAKRIAAAWWYAGECVRQRRRQ